MLVRLAPCDLGASGWGEPWFPCFTHNPGMAMLMMFSFSVLLLFLRHTNPEDDTTLSPLLLRLTLLNWPADHFPLLVVLLVFGWFLVVFVCFVLFRFCVCFVFRVWLLDCDGSLDYVSVSPAQLLRLSLYCPRYNWCNMQLKVLNDLAEANVRRTEKLAVKLG